MSSQTRFRRELRTAVRPRSTPELRAAGLLRGRASSTRWRRTSRDFYVPRAGVGTDASLSPTQRILDVVPLIPATGALTGWAAAFVYGVDDLDGLSRYAMEELPVLICCGDDLGRRNTSRITYTRDRLAAEEVRLTQGIRVATPVRAAFDGARLAANLEDAVVFVDACAHVQMVDLVELLAYVQAHPGWKGVRQAMRAVELADPAARSPGESRLRVCYITEAGLPRPEVNPPIFDLEGGLLGLGDLLDEAAAFVTEYDGSLHRRRFNHHNDNIREERFERAGLTVVRVDSIDLATGRAELIQRLRDGRRDGLARDRRRDRWTLVEPQWWIDQQDPMQQLTAEEKSAFFEF